MPIVYITLSFYRFSLFSKAWIPVAEGCTHVTRASVAVVRHVTPSLRNSRGRRRARCRGTTPYTIALAKEKRERENNKSALTRTLEVDLRARGPLVRVPKPHAGKQASKTKNNKSSQNTLPRPPTVRLAWTASWRFQSLAPITSQLLCSAEPRV